MAVKLTRLTHKIVIQLNLVADSSTTFSSSSGRPVRKLFDTLSYSLPNIIKVYPVHFLNWTPRHGSLLRRGGIAPCIFFTSELDWAVSFTFRPQSWCGRSDEQKNSEWVIKSREWDGVWSTHGRDEESIQHFGRKTRRKETTWKIKA